MKKRKSFGLSVRISFVAFGAFTDGIVSYEQVFYAGPIQNGVDLLHSFDGPVTFQRRKHDISAKEKLVSIFLKPIDPSG